MVGKTVGNYRLVKQLGQGGMGVVYLAEHPQLGRRVAVKFLHPELARSKRIVKRFFNEARAATAIRHPGIVEVFDFGTMLDGSSYITMEFLEGESLDARLKRLGSLPILSALEITDQIASALAASHSKKIVHRDLKPDNLILVPDPHDSGGEIVKVLDFGIAKLEAASGEPASMKTKTGSVMGTPTYMSPEQCRGSKLIDQRTDVYALGVVLYEMLCGQPPFVAEGFGEIAYLHIGTPVSSPRTHNRSISAELEQLILKALAKDMENRFQTMGEFRQAIRALPDIQGGDPVASSGPGQASVERRRPFQTTISSIAGSLEAGRARTKRTRLLLISAGGLALTAILISPSLSRRWADKGARSEPELIVRKEPNVSELGAMAEVPASSGRSPPIRESSIHIDIKTVPSGAAILDGSGKIIDHTPYFGQRARATGTMSLRIEKAGYRAETVIVPLERGMTADLTLRRRSAAQRMRRPAQESAREKPAIRATSRPEPLKL